MMRIYQNFDDTKNFNEHDGIPLFISYFESNRVYMFT